MDGAGLVAAAIAAAAVYRLYSIRLADATPGRRRAVTLARAIALLFHAGVLLLAVINSSRKIALRIEETEMKLLQMEEIISKQPISMMTTLAFSKAMFLVNLGMSVVRQDILPPTPKF